MKSIYSFFCLRIVLVLVLAGTLGFQSWGTAFLSLEVVEAQDGDHEYASEWSVSDANVQGLDEEELEAAVSPTYVSEAEVVRTPGVGNYICVDVEEVSYGGHTYTADNITGDNLYNVDLDDYQNGVRFVRDTNKEAGKDPGVKVYCAEGGDIYEAPAPEGYEPGPISINFGLEMMPEITITPRRQSFRARIDFDDKLKFCGFDRYGFKDLELESDKLWQEQRFNLTTLDWDIGTDNANVSRKIELQYDRKTAYEDKVVSFDDDCVLGDPEIDEASAKGERVHYNSSNGELQVVDCYGEAPDWATKWDQFVDRLKYDGSACTKKTYERVCDPSWNISRDTCTFVHDQTDYENYDIESDRLRTNINYGYFCDGSGCDPEVKWSYDDWLTREAFDDWVDREEDEHYGTFGTTTSSFIKEERDEFEEVNARGRIVRDGGTDWLNAGEVDYTGDKLGVEKTHEHSLGLFEPMGNEEAEAELEKERRRNRRTTRAARDNNDWGEFSSLIQAWPKSVFYEMDLENRRGPYRATGSDYVMKVEGLIPGVKHTVVVPVQKGYVEEADAMPASYELETETFEVEAATGTVGYIDGENMGTLEAEVGDRRGVWSTWWEWIPSDRTWSPSELADLGVSPDDPTWILAPNADLVNDQPITATFTYTHWIIPPNGEPENDEPENDGPENDEPENDEPENDGPENDEPENDEPENDGPENDEPENDGPENDEPENGGSENDEPDEPDDDDEKEVRVKIDSSYDCTPSADCRSDGSAEARLYKKNSPYFFSIIKDWEPLSNANFVEWKSFNTGPYDENFVKASGVGNCEFNRWSEKTEINDCENSENSRCTIKWNELPSSSVDLQVCLERVEPPEPDDEHQLTVESGDNGGVDGNAGDENVSVSANNENYYELSVDDNVNLIPEPDDHYSFDGWDIDAEDGNWDDFDIEADELTFNMPDQAVDVKANFKKDRFNLTVRVGVGGSVEVKASNSPQGTVGNNGVQTFPIFWGETVELTANPDSGYEFNPDDPGSGWDITQGGIMETLNNPLVFSMPTQAVTVEATFESVELPSNDEDDDPITPIWSEF